MDPELTQTDLMVQRDVLLNLHALANSGVFSGVISDLLLRVRVRLLPWTGLRQAREHCWLRGMGRSG